MSEESEMLELEKVLINRSIDRENGILHLECNQSGASAEKQKIINYFITLFEIEDHAIEIVRLYLKFLKESKDW